jgi:hypothetical protein
MYAARAIIAGDNAGCGSRLREGIVGVEMSCIHVKILLALVVAVAALAFAGTASAGWTWDGNAEPVWTDEAPAAE